MQFQCTLNDVADEEVVKDGIMHFHVYLVILIVSQGKILQKPEDYQEDEGTESDEKHYPHVFDKIRLAEYRLLLCLALSLNCSQPPVFNHLLLFVAGRFITLFKKTKFL